jgi:hypothetical protein
MKGVKKGGSWGYEPPWGGEASYLLRSTPQGKKILLCHHVACQVFFSFFLAKNSQAKTYQGA